MPTIVACSFVENEYGRRATNLKRPLATFDLGVDLEERETKTWSTQERRRSRSHARSMKPSRSRRVLRRGTALRQGTVTWVDTAGNWSLQYFMGSVDQWPTAIMSKRPQAPSQPQGPQPKRIHMEEKFARANTRIHGRVQSLLQTGLPLLVDSLLFVFTWAPPEACMRATPSGDEIEELLKDNPDLQKALQDAIDQG
ncbi:hypothetical protein V8E55_011956 [Tylopilus felleus]